MGCDTGEIAAILKDVDLTQRKLMVQSLHGVIVIAAAFLLCGYVVHVCVYWAAVRKLLSYTI